MPGDGVRLATSDRRNCCPASTSLVALDEPQHSPTPQCTTAAMELSGDPLPASSHPGTVTGGAESLGPAPWWCSECGNVLGMGGRCPLHNKFLSVLGPLCLLHQHSPSPVSGHVSAPCVFKKQLLQWDKCHYCAWPGAGSRVVGRKEKETPNSQPVLWLCLPPSSPSCVSCFRLTSLSGGEGL